MDSSPAVLLLLYPRKICNWASHPPYVAAFCCRRYGWGSTSPKRDSDEDFPSLIAHFFLSMRGKGFISGIHLSICLFIHLDYFNCNFTTVHSCVSSRCIVFSPNYLFYHMLSLVYIFLAHPITSHPIMTLNLCIPTYLSCSTRHFSSSALGTRFSLLIPHLLCIYAGFLFWLWSWYRPRSDVLLALHRPY